MRKYLLSLLICLIPLVAEGQSITTATCPGAGCVSYDIGGQGSIGIQITGTWMGTITFQGSLGNSSGTFVSLLVVPSNSTTAVSTTTGNGVWSSAVAGYNTVRVVFTVYTSGTAVVTRRSTTAAKPGGSTGGMAGIPGGSNTQVQFNDSGVFGGDAELVWNKSVGLLSVGNIPLAGSGILSANSTVVNIPNSYYTQLETYTQFNPVANITKPVYGGIASYIELNTAFNYTILVNSSSIGIDDYSTGTVTKAVGSFSYIDIHASSTQSESLANYASLGNTGTGHIVFGSAYYATITKAVGATTDFATEFYGTNVRGQATNGYFLWYDGGGSDCNESGVFRVNDFGILAYYNPCFTVYTPGAANFERIIIRWGDTGVFGTDNLAYIGVQVGGTGTNRVLNLVGSTIGAMSIPGTYTTFTASSFISDPAGVSLTGADGVLTILGLGNGADEDITIDLDNGGANIITFGTGTGATTTVWPFNFDLGGTAGVRESATDGILTLLGQGNGNDENLTLDFDNAAANIVAIASGTGVTGITWTGAFSATTFNASALLNLTTRQSVTVDAATTFAITSSYVNLACTGAESINTITGGSVGTLLYIDNGDTDCTLVSDADPTAANAMALLASDVGAVNKTIVLMHNGTYWQELSESDNQ